VGPVDNPLGLGSRQRSGTDFADSGTWSGVVFYDDLVAVDLVDLPPELRRAVEQARRVVADEQRVTPTRSGRIGSWLTDEERTAVREAVADGSYAAAVAAVVADEPDLASD